MKVHEKLCWTIVPEVVYIFVRGHIYVWKDVYGGIMLFQLLVTNGLSFFIGSETLANKCLGSMFAQRLMWRATVSPSPN